MTEAAAAIGWQARGQLTALATVVATRRSAPRPSGTILQAGVDEDELERIAGPAGLDIGADTPAETALSILAEILAVRAGRAGKPLAETGGRIHAATA